MNRKLRSLTVLAVIASLTASASVCANQIKVNTAKDNWGGQSQPDDGDTLCSLREAIQAAQSTIKLNDCDASDGNGVVEVRIATNVSQINLSSTLGPMHIDYQEGSGFKQIAVTSGAEGSLHDVAIVGAGNQRMFWIVGGSDPSQPANANDQFYVSFRGLTFKNSKIDGGGAVILSDLKGFKITPVLTVNKCRFLNNSSSGDGGGAIKAEGGKLLLVNSFFRGNSTDRDGGAIYIGGSGTSAAIEGSVFRENFARNGGGAILSLTEETGTTIIIRSSFFENSAQGIPATAALASHGGGAIEAKNLIFQYDVFEDNKAHNLGWIPEGGDVAFGDGGKNVGGGAIEITPGGAESELGRSLFRGNIAGVGSKNPGKGGAVYSQSPVTFDQCVVTKNVAFGAGGGVYLETASDTKSYFVNTQLSDNMALAEGDLFGAIDLAPSNYLSGGGLSAGMNAKMALINTTLHNNVGIDSIFLEFGGSGYIDLFNTLVTSAAKVENCGGNLASIVSQIAQNVQVMNSEGSASCNNVSVAVDALLSAGTSDWEVALSDQPVQKLGMLSYNEFEYFGPKKSSIAYGTGSVGICANPLSTNAVDLIGDERSLDMCSIGAVENDPGGGN